MVLYALGSNGSGQLGIGHTDDVAVPTPHEIRLDEVTTHPVAIAGGGNHTLILTNAGDLFASGDLSSHSDDTLSMQKTESAQTMLMVKDVSHCAALWEASVWCHAQRELYSFGKGDRGELGRGSNVTGNALVIDLGLAVGENEGQTAIIDVASGLQHTVVVLESGHVYGWGNGRKGQLGEPRGIVTSPRKIEGVHFPVKRAVCGREFTYLVGNHLEGQHMILGADKWGVQSKAPKAVISWSDIGASWGSIFVLLQDGSVVSWGRDDHGQLSPSGLPSLSMIACGSEHCLGLSKDNRVLAWGWGEHGNCGTPIDAQGDVKPGWNEIRLAESDHEQIRGIAAGCATSWIWTSSKAP